MQEVILSDDASDGAIMIFSQELEFQYENHVHGLKQEHEAEKKELHDKHSALVDHHAGKHDEVHAAKTQMERELMSKIDSLEILVRQERHVGGGKLDSQLAMFGVAHRTHCFLKQSRE